MTLEPINSIITNNINLPEFQMGECVRWSVVDDYGHEVVEDEGYVVDVIYADSTTYISDYCKSGHSYPVELEYIQKGQEFWCYLLYVPNVRRYQWTPEHRIKCSNFSTISSADQSLAKTHAFEVGDPVYWESPSEVEILLDYHEEKYMNFQSGVGAIEDYIWLESPQSYNHIHESIVCSAENGCQVEYSIPKDYTGWIYLLYVSETRMADEQQGYGLWLPEKCLQLIEPEKTYSWQINMPILDNKYPVIDLTAPLSLREQMQFDPKKWARHQAFEELLREESF